MSKSFAQLFIESQVEVQFTSDLKTISWEKECEASALGSILCLTQETCRILRYKILQKLYVAILKEAVQAAKADGAVIEASFLSTALKK